MFFLSPGGNNIPPLSPKGVYFLGDHAPFFLKGNTLVLSPLSPSPRNFFPRPLQIFPVLSPRGPATRKWKKKGKFPPPNNSFDRNPWKRIFPGTLPGVSFGGTRINIRPNFPQNSSVPVPCQKWVTQASLRTRTKNVQGKGNFPGTWALSSGLLRARSCATQGPGRGPQSIIPLRGQHSKWLEKITVLYQLNTNPAHII